MTSRRLYAGTYTRPVSHVTETNGEGIYVMEFDEATGALAMEQVVSGIENPSFLTVAPDGRSLHAGWEVPDWPEGLVSSYSIDPNSGKLRYLGVQGAKGTATVYASMDSRSRYCFIANYASGTISMLPVAPDGSLREATMVVQQEGSGPDRGRQEASHAHSVVVAPDDRFVFSADLGADKVFGYEVDYESGCLIPRSSVNLPAGAGPRHFAFHPDAKSAYATCELESGVAAFAYAASDGVLELIAGYSTLPADVIEHNQSADLHVHPSGRWVYGSNHGHDSVVVFDVLEGGGLSARGHRSTEGRSPRGFAISPDGSFLLAANQDSDTVVVMRIDRETGMLLETVHRAHVPTPVCLAFGGVVAV